MLGRAAERVSPGGLALHGAYHHLQICLTPIGLKNEQHLGERKKIMKRAKTKL